MAINIMWFFLLVLEIYMVLSHEIQICCFKKKFFNSKILLKSTSKPQSFPSSLLKVGSTKGSLISFKTKKFLTFSLHHTHPNKIVYLKDNTDIQLRPAYPYYIMRVYPSFSGRMHFKQLSTSLTVSPFPYFIPRVHLTIFMEHRLTKSNSSLLDVYVVIGFVLTPPPNYNLT